MCIPFAKIPVDIAVQDVVEHRSASTSECEPYSHPNLQAWANTSFGRFFLSLFISVDSRNYCTYNKLFLLLSASFACCETVAAWFETHTAYLQYVDILEKLNKYLHIYIKVIYALQDWAELDFSPGVNKVSSEKETKYKSKTCTSHLVSTV